MATATDQLPPGWAAEWLVFLLFTCNINCPNSISGTQLIRDTFSSVSPFSHLREKYLKFCCSIETATGHTQWEPPTHVSASLEDAAISAPPPPQHHGKRRQYAPGQTQAYYAGDTAVLDPTYLASGASVPAQPQGGQLFTPGLAVENQFAAQQVQQPPAPGQQPSYFSPGEPEYINGPAFNQQPQYGQAPVDALANQFGQMGMGQKQFQLYTTNLLTSPPEPRDLQRPPPEIRLPPNSCVSPSPTANADPSYLRSTINAIPTTSSLLSKSKLPLALIITPYRSLNEGEEPVHLVTDTVIARCRRCRTYINPYVQFIDGGNRYGFDAFMCYIFSHYLVDGDAACAI